MRYAADSYYAALAQVEARFAEEIARVPGLDLTETAIQNHAAYFARELWRDRKGRVPAGSTAFAIKAKIEHMAGALSDLALTNRDMFDLVAKKPHHFLGSDPERIIENTRTTIAMVLELKDPLLPIGERHQVKTPRDAFAYLLRTQGLHIITYSSETIASYRRYAQLVKSGKLNHERYVSPNGSGSSYAFAILGMPPAELKKRLQDYDARAARAVAARKAAIVTPAPAAPSIATKDGRQALAERLVALRAKSPAEPAR
jgi:hypothetical protein